MQCKKIIFAAGGTGGHVFPALATIEKANAAGIECLLITDKRGGKYVPASLDAIPLFITPPIYYSPPPTPPTGGGYIERVPTEGGYIERVPTEGGYIERVPTGGGYIEQASYIEDSPTLAPHSGDHPDLTPPHGDSPDLAPPHGGGRGGRIIDSERNIDKTIPSFTHKTISCGHLVGGIWHKIRNLFALSYGFLQTLLIIKKFRPDIVIGFGSYTSFAPLLIANLLGIKTILHEQNAVMGKTNRFLAKYADKVLISFANTGKIPAIKGRIIHTGNPVRSEIMSLQENYIPSYNLLIIGGSQGSRNLTENITKALLSLPDSLCEKLQITMQCRSEMIEETRKKLAKFSNLTLSLSGRGKGEGNMSNTQSPPHPNPLPNGERGFLEIAPFFSDIPTKLNNASLVISRSGASSVSEIIAAARPSLLIPLPSSSENHQYENALAVEKIGIAKIIPENDDCWREIANNIEYLFNNSHELSQMHDNACKILANDAAKNILEQLCE
jgi:UDP-N-acetylglucosamine--N-acetylmuramyl-(pentapeptide) pyrophosphoryl-undecaprenol N-acetylglucosamine transferase